jgi:hypothetical protein
MNSLIIFSYYFAWHYSQAFGDIFRIWKDSLKFVFHFFSIRQMFATLFSPWERIQDESAKGADLGEIAGNFIFNGIMRGVGVFMRLSVIIAGLAFLAAVILAGVLFILVWILWPFIVFAFFIFGIRELLA